jgi:DNA-binding NtrC family response regulator
MNARILIADDQPDVLEALRILLKVEGFEAVTASSPADVLSQDPRRVGASVAPQSAARGGEPATQG